MSNKLVFVTTLGGFGSQLVSRIEAAGVEAELVSPSRPVSGDEVPVSIAPAGQLLSQTMVNYSDLSRQFMAEPEKRQRFLDLLGCPKEPAVTQLFSLWNGATWAEWMECNYSGRLMNGDVGPSIGFVCGAGHSAKWEPKDALVNLADVEDFLREIEYRGEVLLGVSSDFHICDIRLGHASGIMSMYSEIGKLSLAQLYLWADGRDEIVPEVHDSCVVANMASLSPFPGNVQVATGKLKAPASAEKHLWRLNMAGAEPVIVTCHGPNVVVARNRVMQTMANIARVHPEVQYRTDAATGGRFYFNLVVDQRQLPSDARRLPEVPQAVAPVETADAGTGG